MRYIFLVPLFFLLSSYSWGDIFSCKNSSGKIIYTDSSNDCPNASEYKIKDNISTYSTKPEPSPFEGRVFPIEFGHQNCVAKTAYFKGTYEIKRDRIDFHFSEVEVKKTHCGKGTAVMSHIRAELWSKKKRPGKDYSDETVEGTMVKVHATLEMQQTTTLNNVDMTIYTNDLKSKNLNDYNLVFQIEAFTDGRVGWNYEKYQGDLVPE